MNKKIILSGAVAALVLGTMDASAQFNYQNGDLIAAFGNGGSTDVLVNLGLISTYQQQGIPPFSVNLNSVLTSVFGSVNSSIYWAVFGVNDGGGSGGGGAPGISQGDPNTIWTTLGRLNPGHQTTAPLIQGGSSQFQLPLTDIESIGNVTSPSQASPGLIVDVSPGVEEVSTSVGNFTPMMTNPYNGNFQGDWYYNVLNHGAGVSDFYQNDPSLSRASYLGNFALDPTGNLTFNPVPEPSTWAMAGSGFLLLLALRRRRK
jgi:hypothetical protein